MPKMSATKKSLETTELDMPGIPVLSDVLADIFYFYLILILRVAFQPCRSSS